MYKLFVYLLPTSLLLLICVRTQSLVAIIIAIIFVLLLVLRWKKKIIFVILLSSIPLISYIGKIDNNLSLEANECRITHFEDKTFLCEGNINVIIYSDKILEIGDWIRIDGEKSLFKKDNFNQMDLDAYYKSKNIKYYFNFPSITVIKKKWSPKTNIYNILRENNDIKFAYIKMMFFNYIDSSNREIYNKAKRIGISHIIVISSMHLTFAFYFLNNVLKRFTSLKWANIITFSLLVLFGCLLNFPISFVKAFLLLFANSIVKGKVQKLVLISLIGAILLIYNPLLINDVSFLLTFGISYYICLVQNKNKKIMSFQITLISLLIQIALTNEIGLFNILYQSSIGLVILLSFALTIVFPFMLEGVSKIIDQAYSANIYLTIGNLNTDVIMTMLLLILMVCYLLSVHKRITKLIMILLVSLPPIVLNKQIVKQDFVTFINIGQGDCALVSIAGKNFLVDAGGNYNNSTYHKIIIPYLKYEGISTLDAIFISHNDMDHSGSLDGIKSSMKVDSIIKGNNWYEMNFGNITFNQLNSINIGSDNDNSQVIFLKWNFKKILFLGDVSKDVEEKISAYVSDVDVVKVAHHGSSTSTSLEAYKRFNPKYSVLSYGKNNFGHPHKEVIDTLEQVKTKQLHTYKNGAIKYYFNSGNIQASNML